MLIKTSIALLVLVNFASCGSSWSLPTIGTKNKRQTLYNYPPCQTPNGKHGLCKPLNDCQSLNAHIDDPDPRKISYLWHSQCGFLDEEVKVCCPIPPRDEIPEDSFEFVNSTLLPSSEVCGISTTPKIFGGNETKLGEFPWIVALEYQMYSKKLEKKYTDVRCGGALISKRYVLTAAHCIEPRLVSVRLGEHNLKTNPDCDEDNDCAPKYLSVDIEEQIVFKTYENSPGKKYHDIALLRLKEEVDFSDFIKPICLPRTVEELYKSYVGKRPTVAGWGFTEEGHYSDIQLKVDIPVRKLSACVDHDEGQICAGGEEGKGACRGDSGGPLMVAKRDEMGDVHWFVIGVVSGGPVPCAYGREPSTYVRVSKYVTWIGDNIKP